MSIITQIHDSQKNKLHHFAKNTDAAHFLEVLSNQELANTIENHTPGHRDRIYPPLKTLSMFIAQALSEDRSCSKAVIDMIIQSQDNKTKVSPNTGGYCLARQKLPLPLLTELTTEIGELVVNKIPSNWRWKGKRVCIIDGSSLTMPDTKKSQAVFPQQGAQKPGLGFPICRFLVATCLATGVILNAAIGPFKGKGSDEQSLLRKVLDTFRPGDIVLGDAFYGTYFLLAEMIERGVDVLFEQLGSRKSTTNFGKGIPLGKKDHLIEIPKSKKKPDWMTQKEFDEAPEKILIREIRSGKKILITTLLSAKEYPKKALKDLYKERWHVEVDLRHMKSTLGMNVLSCQSPEMCIKEIWVYFLANNIIRLLISQAAFTHDLRPRQLSFKLAVQIWNTYSLLNKLIDDEMFTLIAKRKVGKRPGRIEPRAVKRRPKPYKLLMVPRDEARKDILKNGHPKKVK